MHFLASLFVLFFAISASSAEQRTTLDEAAQDYVHLVLEIGAHEKGYVDAYFGPSHWRVEAEAHPRVISELKVEADRIQSTLSAMDTSAQQPTERRRNAWLKASVAECAVSPRHNRGRALSFPRRSHAPVRAHARATSA